MADFQDAYSRGQALALQQLNTMMGMQKQKFDQEQVLNELAGVQGITEDQIRGAMAREPGAIKGILGRPGGVKALAMIDKLIPTSAEMAGNKTMPFSTLDLFNQYLGGAFEGKQIPPELANSQLPMSVGPSLVAGSFAQRRQAQSDATQTEIANLRAIVDQYRIMADQQRTYMEQAQGRERLFASLPTSAADFSKQVRDLALRQLTDMNFPSKEGENLAAKIATLAMQKYGDFIGESLRTGASPDIQGFVASILSNPQMKLSPDMSDEEMQNALNWITQAGSMQYNPAPGPLPQTPVGNMPPVQIGGQRSRVQAVQPPQAPPMQTPTPWQPGESPQGIPSPTVMGAGATAQKPANITTEQVARAAFNKARRMIETAKEGQQLDFGDEFAKAIGARPEDMRAVYQAIQEANAAVQKTRGQAKKAGLSTGGTTWQR